MEIINKYRFGSHVYGTNSGASDEDYICVTKTKIILGEINVHYYTISEFQYELDNHTIPVIECYFLPEQHIVEKKYNGFSFNLDKGKLRINISTVSANSWIKARKKLTVSKEYNKYLALNLLFILSGY